MLIVVCAVRTTHPFVLVSVSVAVPAETAAAFGVKTALSAFSFGENVPGPLQVPVFPPAVTDPFKVAVLPAQIVWDAPAFTTGAGMIVKLNEAVELGQLIAPVDVSVITDPPLLRSVEPGVYTAFRSVADGLNVPLPVLLHMPVVVVPATVPDRVTVLPSHIVRSDPADTLVTGRI